MKLTRTSARAACLGKAAAACTFSLALVATACSSDAAVEQSTSETTEVAATPVDGGTLVVGTLYESSGWNPTFDQWGTATAFAGSTMLEPLTTLDAETRPQPWLATAWEANADYTSWTITLREGVTFHNGEPFDAAAVKLNFDDVTASPLTGIALGGAITGATVVDPKTVRIDLSESWAAFPSSFLAGPNAWMRAPAMLADPAAGSKSPIGTGPFKFEEWKSGGSLKLARNDAYWREGEPHLDQIEFLPVVDDISRVNALMSGDVDMMITTSARDATDIESDEEYQVIKDWDTETTLLVVNTRETAGGLPNPMSNKHARLAIAHATDTSVIAGLVGEGIEVPSSPFAAGSPWHDDRTAEAYPDYDVAKAKEEVELYKQETGESSLKVRITGPTETSTVGILQAMEQQWSEAGIETDIEALEHNAHSMQGVMGNFQLIYGPIYAAPDPDQSYHFWSSTTVADDGLVGINFSGFATDSTQEALVRGRSTPDYETRRDSYTDLVSELNADAVNIWLFFTPYSLIAADRVQGLQQAAEVPFGNFQPKTWWGSVFLAEES